MKEKNRLQLHNISKEYFGNKVLKGISFDVPEGAIVALVGENGAGKSTLMNILFGMPVIHSTGGFEGEVRFDGAPVNITSPQQAMELGIGMVHQEFMLLPGFTITENIKLNREDTKPSALGKIFGSSMDWLDMKSMKKDARRALDTIGMGIDEALPVAGLPVGYMQFIEIAREIDKTNTKLLVLDEPTAVLTESEAERLLETMRLLASKGISILFISHRLDEVLSVSDHIVVLRDGELVCSLDPKDTDVAHVAELMVWRKIESHELCGRVPESFSSGRILEIRDLSVNMPGEEVRNLDLDVYRGEILGIGGLAGGGKIGIANGIMGLFPASGTVIKHNFGGGDEKVELNIQRTRDVLSCGLAFVSEDRRGVGLLLNDSIELNITITATQLQDKFMKPGFISLHDTAAMRAKALEDIKELDIRCTGPEQLTRRLSGGNQQKVCIARALALQPDLLLVSEPTRGIDIGAKKLIMDLLVRLNREQGLTVIMTSSELAELRSVCDRIAIIYDGHLQGVLLPTDSDRDFGLMMAGNPIKATTKEVER